MSYVIRCFDRQDPIHPEKWFGPYARRWIAEAVARKQRKLGRAAVIMPVDKEVK